MTLAEFRAATADLDGSIEIVYSHTWHALRTIAVGSYLGANTEQTLILGGYCDNLNQLGNSVLHKDEDDRP